MWGVHTYKQITWLSYSFSSFPYSQQNHGAEYGTTGGQYVTTGDEYGRVRGNRKRVRQLCIFCILVTFPCNEHENDCIKQPKPASERKLLYSCPNNKSDLAKAKVFAMCNEASEFAFRNSHEKNHTKNKLVKTTMYCCWAQGCPCERELVETTEKTGRKTTKTVEVFEIGEHKQKGESSNHLPVKRPSFRWQRNRKNS